MVTQGAIKVLLPNSTTSEQVVTKKNINLAITGNLEYFVDDQKVTKEEIQPALQALIEKHKAANEEVNVLLQADKALNLQDIIDVIDIGNTLQVKMVLLTQKPK